MDVASIQHLVMDDLVGSRSCADSGGVVSELSLIINKFKHAKKEMDNNGQFFLNDNGSVYCLFYFNFIFAFNT